MFVDNWYCESCGAEDIDTWLAFSRTVANGDICICPECGGEIMHFDVADEIT